MALLKCSPSTQVVFMTVTTLQRPHAPFRRIQLLARDSAGYTIANSQLAVRILQPDGLPRHVRYVPLLSNGARRCDRLISTHSLRFLLLCVRA